MNYYERAIEILRTCEYEIMLFEIAKKNPGAIVNAATRLYPPESLNGWKNSCRSLVISGNKFEAIKLYRENTGASLLDSKEAVEKLAEMP